MGTAHKERIVGVTEASTQDCWYCGKRPTDGKPCELALQHATTKEKRRIAIDRCSACEDAHRVGLRAFFLIWILIGVGLAGYVFWLWFDGIAGNPRGYRGMILVTTFLASLPGLALGMLARKMTLRSRGTRGPLDVRGHPQVEVATAQGWRVTR